MTTALTILQRARRDLTSTAREDFDVMDAAVDASTTSFTFEDDVASIQRGSILEVDQELVLVRDKDHGGGADVIRGVEGSTAATHADQAVVTVNPRYPYVRLFEMLVEEVVELSSPAKGLWKAATTPLADTSLTVDATTGGTYFDLSALTTLISLYSADDDLSAVRHYDEVRQWLWAEPCTAGTRTLAYRARFTAPTTMTTDMTTTCGVPASADHLLKLGVQVRALMQRAAKRAYTEGQGDPRRADEVSEGGVTTTLRPVLLAYEQALQAERSLLEQAWPRRRRTGR